jgi:hypothetical protein
MADKLAEFLIRVQVRSEAHPELDGGWFRAFDFRQWDYWGSNADSGWGAWSIEVGWTQAWISTVLALRELNMNLWDLSKGSQAGKHFEKCRRLMLDGVSYTTPATKLSRHAATGKPVRLAASPDPRYPGCGAASLTDGLLAAADHTDPFWLGFLGKDLEATIDLGEATEIRRLAANFLESPRLGVFLPARVEFSLSDDGKSYRIVATVKPVPPLRDSAPRTEKLSVDGPKGKARYVRVRAVNHGKIPAWVTQQDLPAWLFIDEILVNP